MTVPGQFFGHSWWPSSSGAVSTSLGVISRLGDEATALGELDVAPNVGRVGSLPRFYLQPLLEIHLLIRLFF